MTNDVKTTLFQRQMPGGKFFMQNEYFTSRKRILVLRKLNFQFNCTSKKLASKDHI
jgi:hypothetical protein